MSVMMRFGSVGETNDEFGDFELIGTGTLGGENLDTVTFDLTPRQMYILFTREITISNGVLRGYRARLLARTENNTAFQAGNLFASTNSGVTMTLSADEILTIKPSAKTYDVHYALYAVM